MLDGWRASGAAGVALTVFALSGCSPTPAPSSEPTPTVTVTVTAPTEGATDPASVIPSATSTEKIVTVNAAKYLRHSDLQGVPGYGFDSPSGRLMCGILTDLQDGSGKLKNPLVGCLTVHEVANFDCADWYPEMNNPDYPSYAPAIEFYRGRKAGFECYHEGGLYGGKVLRYGERISVLGVTCTSRKTGITCVDDNTGRGFTAARAGFNQIG